MRIDHLAYRTADRWKTANFFISAFGYRVQQEFTIDFGDGQTAQCIALEPPEKPSGSFHIPWTMGSGCGAVLENHFVGAEYHLPPEIFVSDGSPGSIVGEWVAARGGIGGIHHIAYQVDDVEKTMVEWKEKGYAEFTSEQPMTCDNIVQVFSKPSLLTGVIYEFITRGEHGFCQKNVQNLMLSTKNL